MTAEFAMVVPAALMVLAFCLGGLQLASTQLRLQDAAATAARSLARGESVATASSRVRELVGGATFTRSTRGGMACAELTARGRGGALAAITVTASSCALAGG